ncbi:MAG: hypothetical protein ACI4KF_05060 [Huintestinicola sp.]
MDGSGFLKTVNFGGFDKKDVLNYVDQLNTKIYTLENELEEKKALLENSGGNMEDKEKYEQLLSADKAKITELQTSNDSLKMQLKTTEDEMAQKDAEIADLKKKIADMENELVDAKNKAAAASSNVDNNALDLSNVFIEAQRTANTIVTQAKENARKMDEDAKKLANQVVDDANSKASTIVKSADEKASKILTDANDKSAEMRTAADNMKAVILAEVKEITTNINKLQEVFNSLTGDSMTKIKETSTILSDTEATLTKGGIPQFKAPAGVKPAPAPAPVPVAAKPAPAPAPAAKPAPAPAPAAAKPAPAPAPKPAPAPTPVASKPAPAKPAGGLNKGFDFDLSEIQKLANAIDAGASKNSTKGTPLNDGYDGNVDAKSIKLSDMM